jgi:glucose-6-phosphate 1-epimerase
MTASAADLSAFAIPGILAIATGEGGLPRLEVRNAHAVAHVYLHGAHVSHFQPHGAQPVLWMSAHSLFTADKPIRGGVPLCWPWFGPHASDATLPAHGFVRSRPWTLVETATLHDGRTRVVLGLASDPATLALWPHAFALRLTVTVGRTLELDLRVDNPGTQPFTCAEAFHTYLTVGDVRQVRISGLSGTTYVDKVRQQQRFSDQGDLAIAAETDRVYLGTRADCVLHDPLLARRVVVAKENSLATVVWNPWVAKALAMKDFGDDEWPGMVCIETVNALDHALTVPAGGSHHLVARIGVAAT